VGIGELGSGGTAITWPASSTAGLLRQLTRCKASTVVPYRVAILKYVSPAATV
jgi:hypothetical protein